MTRIIATASRRGIRAARRPLDPTLRRAAAAEGVCRALGVERLTPAQTAVACAIADAWTDRRYLAGIETSSLDDLGLDDGSADEVRALHPGETYGVGAGGSAAWQITRLW